MFDRMRAIDGLIECEIDTIVNGQDLGVDHLEWMLRNGVIGFEEMSDSELITALEVRGIELDIFFGEVTE